MRDGERAALARLTQLGGERLTADLAAIYLDEMPRRVAAARDALRNGDAPALADVAHAMKSSSAQLGAAELAAACEAVEELAERGDIARASDWLAAVETRFATFGEWLAGQTGTAAQQRPDDTHHGVLGSAAVETPVITVIEDNVDNRLLVDAILGDRFVLHEYAAGTDALVGMAARRPDLVLLDVSLPGMDGLEVLARMRVDPTLRDVPVVALTAHAMTGDRERYLSAGFDGYVPKPIVDERVLIDAVERLLSRRPVGPGPSP